MGSATSKIDAAVISQAEEASRARSDDEFTSKLGGALQETDESALWLELLREECGIDPTLTKPLENEADELMTTMINKTKPES
jgi:four helix bundle protein